MKRVVKRLLLGLASAFATVAAADSVTFYQDDNYRGRQFIADRPVTSLDRNGFNDRVRSAVVHEGRWEICMHADFNGGCSVVAPGAYPTLGAYAGRISSVRPIDGGYADKRSDDRSRIWEARATVYEGPNLSGRSFPLNTTMPNRRMTGFNNHASSLHVETGYWIFCSEEEFRGECRTFGPGDYASLQGLDNAISSGRRISNDYPYSDRPNWQRDPMRQSQNFQSHP